MLTSIYLVQDNSKKENGFREVPGKAGVGGGGGGCVPTDSAQTSRVEGKERKDVCVSLCDHAPALNLRPPERLFVDQRRSTIF